MLCMKDDLLSELMVHIPNPVVEIEADGTQSAVRSIFKWLQSLDASVQSSPTFIMTVAKCIFSHVTMLTTLKKESMTPDEKKQSKAQEKTTLQALAAIVEKYVSDNVKKQTDVIYALQSFCYDKKFPRGMMLRLSMHLYELDVVEGDAWMMWKEEVNEEIPGKGDALIETNEYLNWMRTAVEESESESDDDDDDVDAALPKKGQPRV